MGQAISSIPPSSTDNDAVRAPILAEADDGEPFAVPGHALDQVFDRTGAGRPCRSAT
jgi:hypothetical protein